MTTVIVTGGAGFIGSSVVRELLHQDDLRVVVVDKLTYAGNLDSLAEIADHDRFCFYCDDICDRARMNSIFSAHEPSGVIHLAAESHVDRSISGPDDFIQTNVVGTFVLLEASRTYLSKQEESARESFRFHHVSTDEVYGDLGDSGSFFTETTPYDPSSPYSASKASSDHLVRAWGRTFGLPFLITNSSNNYGPRQFPEKLIPHLILNALGGKPLPVYGEGSQVRDWLYVEDHARAIAKVFLEGGPGETYLIGGHNERRNLEVVHHICELLEKHAGGDKPDGIEHYGDLITFVKERPGHDFRYAIDASKIERELGWTPLETFASGLEKTVLWYLEHRDWWEALLSTERESTPPG